MTSLIPEGLIYTKPDPYSVDPLLSTIVIPNAIIQNLTINTITTGNGTGPTLLPVYQPIVTTTTNTPTFFTSSAIINRGVATVKLFVTSASNGGYLESSMFWFYQDVTASQPNVSHLFNTLLVGTLAVSVVWTFSVKNISCSVVGTNTDTLTWQGSIQII